MIRCLTAPLLAASLLFGLTACETEVDNKPAAEVKAPTAPAEKPAPAGEMVKVDAANSTINFVGAKVTGQHDGGFKGFEGGVTVADGKVTATQFTVDTTTVWTDKEKLTGHLKDADFFDVATYPKASFVSTAIAEKASPEGATHSVTGNLEFHGVTKEITFPATVTVDDAGAALTANFTIKRFDWGVAYKGKADDLIKDDVLLKLDLKFPRS